MDNTFRSKMLEHVRQHEVDTQFKHKDHYCCYFFRVIAFFTIPCFMKKGTFDLQFVPAPPNSNGGTSTFVSHIFVYGFQLGKVFGVFSPYRNL